MSFTRFRQLLPTPPILFLLLVLCSYIPRANASQNENCSGLKKIQMVSTTEHEQSRAILNSCVQEWISELGAHLKVAVNNEFDLRPISVIFEQTVASPWFDNQTTPWSVHLPRISGVSLDNWKRAVLHELGHAVYRQIFESKVTKIDIFNQWSETYMKERMKRRVAELTLLTQQESTLKKSLEDQTCVLTCHTETETRLQSTRREIAKSLERIPFQILLSAQCRRKIRIFRCADLLPLKCRDDQCASGPSR